MNYDTLTNEHLTNDYLKNDCLKISTEELLILKQKNPFEVEIIMEMLAEAGEDFTDEVNQLEMMMQKAA